MKPTVAGFGINDAWYPVTKNSFVQGKQKQIWKCPFYAVWKSMIERCYSPSSLKKDPSYAECTVCDEWLVFSNFRKWMDGQKWVGREIDKDILCPGNKVYGPEFCVFVEGYVNNFLIDRKSCRGKWPIGVFYDSRSKKFIAQCNCHKSKQQKKLGSFDSPQEAHEAWRVFKLGQAMEIAKAIDDKRVAEAIVDRYTNYTPELEVQIASI